MTTSQLQRIHELAILLERYSRYAERADEGREVFEKSVIDAILALNLEIK